MTYSNQAFLTDSYVFPMLQAYLAQGMTQTASFELFVRRLPKQRNFLVAAGLEQALEYIETLRFVEADLEWLARTVRCDQSVLDYLEGFQFTGDVDAMPEGTVFFANEPILRITAPLPQAQLLETRLLNLIHFQSVIASKAARHVLVAPGKRLIEFGFRRAHGAEAGVLAARASYLSGFDGTSAVAAGKRFNIPLYGTMAHSFIEAHDEESLAFEHFIEAVPQEIVLLLDTYDTEVATHATARLTKNHFKKRNITLSGVRIDSGDLAKHAKKVRKILDEANLNQVKIIASGGLDEYEIQKLLAQKAPIDTFGIGTRLTTSADEPFLDCAYKLQEYAGVPRKKLSEGKATLPGRKQVYRITDENSRYKSDTLALLSEPAPQGRPLLTPFMKNGQRISPSPPLNAIRESFLRELQHLPAPFRRLDPAPAYEVRVSELLAKLASG